MSATVLAVPHEPCLLHDATLALDEPSHAEPAANAPTRSPAISQLGRFDVLGQLGAGGMGVVFAAHDRLLDRRVALKLLHRHQAADPRIWREARALARVSHPNVVQIFEIGEHAGQLFLAMELVAGPSLARWLRDADRPPAQILDVFHQAGQGLAAAHAAGLVHGDFKPANVIVGADGRVRLVDFGLACRRDDDDPAASDHATRSGTPRYASPEQRRGESLLARSDQFSFCVALQEALARSATGRVREVLIRGLAEDPDDRFPDMSALCVALRRARAPRRRRSTLASRRPGPACR